LKNIALFILIAMLEKKRKEKDRHE